MSNITFAITSCGRFDLLEKTLDTFLKYNTYTIQKFILVEDSQNKQIFDLLKKYPFIDIIFNDEKQGQIKSIDKLYSKIQTPYIFHSEDDWEFTKSGFLENSLKILENDKKIFQVWIREKLDHQHPLLNDTYSIDSIQYKELLPMWNNIYSGFSFNPGLRRKKDYDLIRPYEKVGGETRIGIVYSKLGYKFVSLTDGYCRHIGYSRHIEDSEIHKNMNLYYDFDVGEVKRFINE